jgi:hypothetical protein
MPLNHSEETHRQLLERIPQATGRGLPEWFKALDDGPAFLRSDEQVSWLRDEYGLSQGYASAICHERAVTKAKLKLA